MYQAVCGSCIKFLSFQWKKHDKRSMLQCQRSKLKISLAMLQLLLLFLHTILTADVHCIIVHCIKLQYHKHRFKMSLAMVWLLLMFLHIIPSDDTESYLISEIYTLLA